LLPLSCLPLSLPLLSCLLLSCLPLLLPLLSCLPLLLPLLSCLPLLLLGCLLLHLSQCRGRQLECQPACGGMPWLPAHSRC
jgi:hypothetical protein